MNARSLLASINEWFVMRLARRLKLDVPDVHRRYVPSPFYDLLSDASYDTPSFDKQRWPVQTQLAWPILGVRHFSDINRALLLKAGAALNLAKGTAERLLENLRSRVVQEAQALYAEVAAENARISNERQNLSATMAGESRCLRTIVHTIINEMAKRLG